MLTHTYGWSHTRGNKVVPSPWQATPPLWGSGQVWLGGSFRRLARRR